MQPFSLGNGQLLPTGGAAASDDLAAANGAHALEKPMAPGALAGLRLVCPLWHTKMI